MMQPPDVVPPLAPMDSPAKSSETAIFSLVLGLLSFLFCLGPFAAIPAIVLGIMGNREIARSNGRVGGGALSVTGIALGVANLLGSAALLVGAIVGAASSTHHHTPPPPVAIAPTAPPPIHSPLPPLDPHVSGDPEDQGGQMTTIGEVTETQAGKITVVDIPPTVRSLVAELSTQHDKAKSAHQKLLLLTVTEGCRPCLSIGAILLDPKMQAALDGVRLVRVDALEARVELEDLGVPTHSWPGFSLLGPTLRAVDGINGGEWDDDTPDNAAPVLGAFVRGTYKVSGRKQPFVPDASHGSPRPAPTML